MYSLVYIYIIGIHSMLLLFQISRRFNKSSHTNKKHIKNSITAMRFGISSYSIFLRLRSQRLIIELMAVMKWQDLSHNGFVPSCNLTVISSSRKSISWPFWLNTSTVMLLIVFQVNGEYEMTKDVHIVSF